MAIRKKSRFENFFSWNQHRKRLGALEASSKLETVDISSLKQKTVKNNVTTYTHGADKNLSNHLRNLGAEFSGESELLYYHAKLIVLIRREHKVDANFNKFNELWDTEGSFLIKKLNTRWLMSAADTFADYSKDPLDKALALSASLLVNTIKLQETERFIQSAETKLDDEDKITILKTRRVPLFDGTSAFAVGTDDTLRNMRWRLDSTCKRKSATSKILQELFDRIQVHDTVYARFKKRHNRKKTAWW